MKKHPSLVVAGSPAPRFQAEVPVLRASKKIMMAMALWLLSAALAIAGDQGLGRTWAKLDRDKELVIGYFGGSITEGTGASDASKTSWRALTTAWFKTHFPDAKITEINAAIGSTGTHFGAFRCKYNLLCGRPNLVFVEFAVNDATVPEKNGVPAMEGIVRQIWEADPATDIVFVYTTVKKYETYSQGRDPQTVVYQQRIADYYGIPSVNVGKPISQAIQDGKGTWETLTKDLVHPNDDGYRFYADVVAKFLEARRSDRPSATLAPLPAPLSPNPLDSTQVVDPWDVEAPGWIKETKTVHNGQFPHWIGSNTPGTELTLPFSGSEIGLYCLEAADAGNIEYSIDDAPATEVSTWNAYSVRSSRSQFKLLRGKLPPGKHVMRLKVSEKKAEQSTGNWVRIGAFFTR